MDITPQPKIHQGRNIKRLREILDIKQETLAHNLGMSQQFVSDLEQKEEIEETMLKKIASVMEIPVEAIKNFKEEGIVNIISSTFNDSSMSGWYANHYQCTFNPIDKVVKLYEEKEKLYEEKEQLYERMIKEKEGVLDKLLELLNRKTE